MTLFGRRGAARHARLQAILAVAAIGAAVALPVVLIGVGGGVAAHELASLEDTGYQIVVSAAGLHGISGAHAAAAKILADSAVAFAAPILSVPIVAFNSSGNLSAVLAEGVIPREFTPTLGPTERYLFPTPLPLGDPNDSTHFANGSYSGVATYDVLVSSTFAASYRVHPGQSIILSPTVNESRGVRYNVTGVFGVALSLGQPNGAFAVLLPLSDLQVLAGFANGTGTVVPDGADTIEVVLSGSAAADPSTVDRITAEIQAEFPYYTVSTLSEEAQQLASANAVLTGFYLALSSVGLAVGLLFLALVLLRRVEADRRSIGVRRALGIPGSSIAGEIVRDGLVLSAAGSATGVVGGIMVVFGLARWGSPIVAEAAHLAVFDPLTLGPVIVAVVALSAGASAVAARSALSLEIGEVLR